MNFGQFYFRIIIWKNSQHFGIFTLSALTLQSIWFLWQNYQNIIWRLPHCRNINFLAQGRERTVVRLTPMLISWCYLIRMRIQSNVDLEIKSADFFNSVIISKEYTIENEILFPSFSCSCKRMLWISFLQRSCCWTRWTKASFQIIAMTWTFFSDYDEFSIL